MATRGTTVCSTAQHLLGCLTSTYRVSDVISLAHIGRQEAGFGSLGEILEGFAGSPVGDLQAVDIIVQAERAVLVGQAADPQFEWFERAYDCRESDPKGEKRRGRDKDKEAAAPEKQGLKRVREFYKKQYDAWLKEREAAEKKDKADAKESPRSFTDKIAELLDDGGKRRRR